MSDAVQEPSAVQLQEEANRELRQKIIALQQENEAAALAANNDIRLNELRNEQESLQTELAYQERLREGRLGVRTEEVAPVVVDEEAKKASDAAEAAATAEAKAAGEAAALATVDPTVKATQPTPLFPAVGADQLESKIGKDK